MQSKIIHLTGKLPMSRDRAAKLVSAANAYPCGVYLEKDNFTVNAKSTLGLLSISQLSCRQLKLVTDGPREEEAIEVLARLLSEEDQDNANG